MCDDAHFEKTCGQKNDVKEVFFNMLPDPSIEIT